jgi:putative methyltransferase (TIGR04325 family)
MRSRLRAVAERLIPPAVKDRLALALHQWRGDATIFEGDYPSWDEAAKATTGYANASILERTRQAALKAKNDPNVFERDSVILARPEYPLPLLATLMWVALRKGGRLDVVDFGGSLGSSFFHLRRFLEAVPHLRWAVVEQPHYVDCGNRDIAGEGLSFHRTVEEALRDLRPDVLLMSSVLQYLPTPHATLERLLSNGFSYVILDRTALHEGDRDRLTVQQNPASIYQASYPAWFFAEGPLLESFLDQYRLVYDFAGQDRALLAGSRTYHRGYIFERLEPRPLQPQTR